MANNLVLNCGVVMVLLMVIALICIGLILQPVEIHEKDIWGIESINAPAATTSMGLVLRAEAWKEYPKYNIGLGIVAGLAFLGSVFMCRLMYLAKEKADDALQSKIRGM